MTLEEINTMIASIGLPYAYYQFKEDTRHEPPFLCFLYAAGDDFYADGVNYQQIDTLVIEHYADDPDFDTDERIGEKLNEHGLSYVRTPPVFIESERMWQTVFTTEVDISKSDERNDTNAES